MRHVAVACIIILGWVAGASAAEPITTASLLPDLTDVAALAEFPSPPYVTRQFSSYDRRSKSPTEDGWFANGDMGHYLRTEPHDGRSENVMADMKGPGAIVRIWSANPKGTLRIYLDGADTPVIAQTFADLLSGQVAGFPSPIAHLVSRGYNLYFPIAYAKSAKVTVDARGLYYHVNYRTYPDGTDVRTFQAGDPTTSAAEIQNLAAALSAPRNVVSLPNGTTPRPFDIALAPGQSASLGQFTGPAAIRQIIATLTADDREAALRAVVIHMSFDDEQTVEAPLGDFFGSAPGINAYESLVAGMTKDGEMWTHWVMPFGKSAEVSVVNLGKVPASIKGGIVAVPYTWGPASMHFHAGWRAQYDIATRPNQRDWNYLTATGRGVFVGCELHIDNPSIIWWGEGDEKIYVDGESFPSDFGTGTEDYFGYAWSSGQLFTNAFHNQTRCDGPGNSGRTSLNRWHIIDRIPFAKSFKFDMEVWHARDCTMNQAVTMFWYASPGGTSAYKPIDPADLVLRPNPYARKVPGVIEGESMKVLQKKGVADKQDRIGSSGGEHLWWHDAPKPGDVLALSLRAPAAGRYHIFGRFMKAPDYAIVQIAINSQNAGAPIDFYARSTALTEEMDLGVFDLQDGENRFSATITGANPAAQKKYIFAIDYLRLTAVKE